MRIIITGGTGLIGQALAAKLIVDRPELDVIILSRSTNLERRATETTSASNMRLVQWDAQTTQGWGHLVDGAEAIINLAGANVADARWTSTRKNIILESRLNAGKAILQALEQAQNKPSVLLQSSAIGYYGACGDEEITEDSKPGQDFLAHVCLAWESITPSVENMGIRTPILRTGVVLSRDGGALAKMLPAFKFFAGGPLGNGKQWFPWIHLADEIAAIQFLLTHETATGPFNLTAPNPVTNAEFSRVLGRVLKRPTFMPVPQLALQLALGELSEALLTGQRAVPKRLLASGFQFSYPEMEMALKNLLIS